MEKELGYRHYMFIDGDLPGNGDDMSLPGHEAMMITNKNKEDAHINVTLYFEDKEHFEIIQNEDTSITIQIKNVLYVK